MAYRPYSNTNVKARQFVYAAQSAAMQATYLDENDRHFTAHQRLMLENRWVKTINLAMAMYEAARKDYLDNRKNNAC